jgi:hypothetical protein
MAKFRCGVEPIRFKTVRYENLLENERICFKCIDTVADEKHVVLHCTLYVQYREELFISLNQVNNSFNQLADIEKLCIMFSNENVVKFTPNIAF